MTSFIDQMEQTLQQSQMLNFLRWPVMLQTVHQNPRSWGSYTAEVQNVRRYMKERIAWMDNKLGYTYTPPTSISTQMTDNEPAVIYDLSGRLMSADALPKGIYIVRQGSQARKVVIGN